MFVERFVWLDLMFMGRNLFIDLLAFENKKAFGYQEYVFNLLEYFYNHRQEILYDKIFLVCLSSQAHCFDIYKDRLGIISYNCSSLFVRIIIQTFLPIFLKLNRFDLILYTANYSSLIKRCNHILVIHDLLFKRKDLLPNIMMRIQRSIYVPFSIKLSDKIIAISQFTIGDIEKFYPYSKGKIVMIYNHFNFEKFLPVGRVICRENFFISVASSAYHKNTMTLLKAFNQYCLNGGKYDLIIVGGLKERSKLFQVYSSFSDNVKSKMHFYKNISNEELSLFYQKSKAYISTSLFEGLGMPIVEAMYFNLPVILSNCSSVFYEISLNKGFYFDPLDVNMLVKRMFEVQNKNIVVNYSSEIKELYSSKNTSAKYIDLINSFYNKK